MFCTSAYAGRSSSEHSEKWVRHQTAFLVRYPSVNLLWMQCKCTNHYSNIVLERLILSVMSSPLTTPQKKVTARCITIFISWKTWHQVSVERCMVKQCCCCCCCYTTSKIIVKARIYCSGFNSQNHTVVYKPFISIDAQTWLSPCV